jgi:hypothetical protein
MASSYAATRWLHTSSDRRTTAAPGADLGALATDAEELLEPGNDWTDGLPMPGWEREQEESWLVMSWTPQPVSSRAEPVGQAGAADRGAGAAVRLRAIHLHRRELAHDEAVAGGRAGRGGARAYVAVPARSLLRHRPQTTPRWRSTDRPGSPSCARIVIGFALDEREQRTHLARVEPAVAHGRHWLVPSWRRRQAGSSSMLDGSWCSIPLTVWR